MSCLEEVDSLEQVGCVEEIGPGGARIRGGQGQGARVRGGQPRTVRVRGGQARGGEIRARVEVPVARNVWSVWPNVLGEIQVQDVGQDNHEEEEEEHDQGVSSQEEDGREENNLEEQPQDIYLEL